MPFWGIFIIRPIICGEFVLRPRDERIDVAFLSFLSYDQLSYLQLHESKLDQHLIHVLFLSRSPN